MAGKVKRKVLEKQIKLREVAFCFRIEWRLSFHCESVQDYKENVTDSNINPNRYALNTFKEGAKKNQTKTVLP